MPTALLSRDLAVLEASANYPMSLFHVHGSPDRSTCEAIAESTGHDFVDVWTSLKLLKRSGHLDEFGVVENPRPTSHASGFYSITDVLLGKRSEPISIDVVPPTDADLFLSSAVAKFVDADRLLNDEISGDGIAEAVAPLLLAARALCVATDEAWTGILKLAEPSKQLTKLVDPQVDALRKLLRNLDRPCRPIDTHMVGQAIIDDIRNLVSDLAKAQTNLQSKGRSPVALPSLDTLITEKYISQVRELLSKRVDTQNASAFASAIESEMSRVTTEAVYDMFPCPLTEKSLRGVVSEFVDAALPCTEADEQSLAYQFLVAVGNSFGTVAYTQFGADRHYPALYQLIIGGTSTGKGQAWSNVRTLMDEVDPLWALRCKYSAASGEGLVRIISESESDPRVFAVLPELAVLLNSMNREGSNLSGYLRQAWDRLPLELNRARVSLAASNYLLSAMGHITPSELRETLGNVDLYNGVANRFLWAAVKRSKVLPRMSKSPNFTPLAEKLKALLCLPAPGLVTFSKDGAAAWDSWVYSLSEPKDEKLAAASERAKPNALRLALLYALMDERRLDGRPCQIDPEHVHAAAELVGRSRQTIEWFFRQPSPSGQTSSEEIRVAKIEMNKNCGRLTSTDLKNLFPKKTPDERVDLATRAGFKSKKETASTNGGKPPVVWTWG